MDSQFNSSVDGLKDLYVNIIRHRDNMSGLVEQIRKDIVNLQEEWNSPAGEALVNQYNELYGLVSTIVASIEGIENALFELANSLQEGEGYLIGGL